MLFFFSRRCLIICMLLITFYSCYSFSFNNQQMTSNLCLHLTPIDCQGFKSLLQNILYTPCTLYLYKSIVSNIYVHVYMDTNLNRQTLFSRVDKDRSGQISVNELQTALSNGKIVFKKGITNSGFMWSKSTLSFMLARNFQTLTLKSIYRYTCKL